ncbi:MAG TPA: DNA-formamidopyrimidine glycosylase family protein [Rudaea sp.]|jgi:endonuclease-8|nr:DNA-formamidopyrimidine glycosylase family protein [Rudaea sp.]
MPEGPSIVILREQTQAFVGKIIRNAEGNSRLDKTPLIGQRVVSIRSFGKQFLIELPTLTIRIHLMMFGSYRVNERTDRPPRLRLTFARGEINFYACSVRYLEDDLDAIYDWRGDVMSDAWDPKLAAKRLRQSPDTLVCDALLDQNIFAGAGNIIKNEVLFRIRVHPLSTVGSLPARKLREMVKQARTYSFQFLEWKKEFTLRKHWLAHNKSICPRDQVKFTRAHLGVRHRRSFFCELCQRKYAE